MKLNSADKEIISFQPGSLSTSRAHYFYCSTPLFIDVKFHFDHRAA